MVYKYSVFVQAINLILLAPHKFTTFEYFIIAGSVIIVVFGFCVLFFILYYQKRLIALRKNEANLLLQTALTSEIAERQRIAADIHDSVAGDLSSVRNYMTVLAATETDTEKRAIYESIKGLINEAFENIREVSYKLMPPLLESKGLIPALRNLLHRLSMRSDVHFELNVTSDSFSLSETESYEVYRVIQELTTNIIKYANASKCTIILDNENSRMNVEVFDDGATYDFEFHKKEGAGLGLMNIESRLKTINGKIIQKKAETGNHIVIWI